MATMALTSGLVLGLIFLFAGVQKIRDMRAFYLGIVNYDLLPLSLAWLASKTLPMMEVVVGVVLVQGSFRRVGAFLSICLLGLFLIAALSAVATNKRIPCSCFGMDSEDAIGFHTIVHIGFLILLSMMALLADQRSIFAENTETLLAAIVLGAAIILILRVVEAMPLVIKAFGSSPAPKPTSNGGRISLRGRPLEPLRAFELLTLSPLHWLSERWQSWLGGQTSRVLEAVR